MAVPARIGPCELGAMVAVRCPRDLDDVLRGAGGLWEPGNRRWLIERQRIDRPALLHPPLPNHQLRLGGRGPGDPGKDAPMPSGRRSSRSCADVSEGIRGENAMRDLTIV